MPLLLGVRHKQSRESTFTEHAQPQVNTTCFWAHCIDLRSFGAQSWCNTSPFPSSMKSLACTMCNIGGKKKKKRKQKIQIWRHWQFFLTSIPSLFKAYSSKFKIAVLIVRGGGNTVKPILIALLRFESNTMISCLFPSAAVFLVKKRTRILFLQPVS